MAALALACAQGYAALDYSNPKNNNYVQEWGKLKLVGNQLSSENGQPVQLRGWSTHGKQWQGNCFDEESDFQLMKEKGANIARIAMYITEGGSVDPNWMKQCIEWTNKNGMYCLIDWHILTPGNPNASVYSGAENFFNEMSKWINDNGYKNCIYEICNEPNENVDGDPYMPKVWGWIKRYADKILPVIAKNDPGAVVVVGTPQWDKALSCPMEDPLDTRGLNVMYTFHHYACDQQMFRGILSGAAASIPVFVTEWGVSKDDGGADGKVCLDEAEYFLSICNGKNLGNQVISWCNWSWAADFRSSSAFKNYPNDMSESGKFIESQLKKGDKFLKATSTAYQGGHKFDGAHDLIIALENYDEGGQDNAYFDLDREDWGWVIGNNGDTKNENLRPGENVDMGYTDKNDKDNCYKNIGYIVNGEWVKYTIDVKTPGIYEFELYTCDHIDNNIVGISVDGENALVNDMDGTEKVRAFKMKTAQNGDENGGYDVWGWTTPTVANEEMEPTNFYINFKKSGQQTLGIAFLTANAGLGSIKIKGDPKNLAGVANTAAANAVAVYPNPAENGAFNVSASQAANVKVTNMQGQVVYQQAIEAGETNIAISTPGIYFVTIESNNDVVTKKLVVK